MRFNTVLLCATVLTDRARGPQLLMMVLPHCKTVLIQSLDINYKILSTETHFICTPNHLHHTVYREVIVSLTYILCSPTHLLYIDYRNVRVCSWSMFTGRLYIDFHTITTTLMLCVYYTLSLYVCRYSLCLYYTITLFHSVGTRRWVSCS